MPDFKQQYKNLRADLGDTGHRRLIRAYKKDQLRRKIRTQAFDKNRQLLNVSVSPQRAGPVIDERKKKLIQWKEQRNRRRRLEDAQKKPVFKVGIVHHSFYSPVTKGNAHAPAATVKVPKQMTPPNDVQKRITRATQKRLLAKAAAAVAKQISATSKNIVSENLTNFANIRTSTSAVKKQKSFAPTNHEFRPPSGLPKMPLFGLVAMEPTPSEKGDFFIQDRVKESKASDTHNKEDIQLQKINTQIPDPHVTRSKSSVSPKASPDKKKSRYKTLNESIINDNSGNVTFELDESTTARLSLDEQTGQNSIQEKRFSLNDSNMKTPLQKTPLTNKSSEKENGNENLIAFSPYLTLSRGKSNARKEQQVRLGIGRSSSDGIPTKDTVMKNLNISIEEEERTAQYFKLLLKKETDRLRELCQKWSDIRLEKNIPEDAIYEINQAVGQTNLLISKKFERFRGLVLDCETGRGEMLVTCRDLQGFWDMTYMEVRDCDLRFEKLEQCRERNWQEDHCVTVETIPAAKKRMPIKKQIASTKTSLLRSLILAARQKKMAETLNAEDSFFPNKGRVTPPLSNRKSVAFKENLHNTRQFKSIDNKITPNRRNSLRASSAQKIQFSDTSKRMKSPFAIMKISQMCKTPEVQLDDTILYVNSDQTPAKSILKKSEEIVNKETRVKSAHKVNFDDQVALTEVPVDEETQIKLSLATALSRIDSLDLDDFNPVDSINAEKKLVFETEDSSASDHSDNSEWISETQTEFNNKSTSFVQNVSDSSMGPLKDITSKGSSPNDNLKVESRRRSSRHRVCYENAIDNGTTKSTTTNISYTALSPTNAEAAVTSKTTPNITNMDQEYNSGIRVLRNRIIAAANDTPKIKTTRSKRSINKKENKTPVKSNRKGSLKLLPNDENEHMPLNDDNAVKINEKTDKKRRSTRKSVVFNVDDTCLACSEHKPVLPMTPHSKRRSRTSSRQSRGKDTFDDLISWETPEHPPSRVTRSHAKNL